MLTRQLAEKGEQKTKEVAGKAEEKTHEKATGIQQEEIKGAEPHAGKEQVIIAK